MEEYNVKLEERKKYIHYFRVWMIIAAIAVCGFGVMKVIHLNDKEASRNNSEAPSERVFDYADVLTDTEEKELAELIEKQEEYGKCDIILVTINQEVGLSDYAWEQNMMDLADDFYDERAYGYDQPHGDGVLILDNWYHQGQSDSQAGTWISTSGKMIEGLSDYERERVLDAEDEGFNRSTKDGYASAIKKIAQYAKDEGDRSYQLPWLVVLIIPVIVAIIYCTTNMKQKAGVDTTSATTYVPGGHPELRAQRDDFIRKNVTKVKIETSSSSGSRGGGSHRSSGGFSHGGGGRRR